MKKIYLLFAVIFTAFASALNVQSQTDVTTTYLVNAGFDTEPICYTKAGGATLTSGVTRIGTTGWIFNIPGWTNASIINANAVQVASGEYGTTPTNAQGFNNVLSPTIDKSGANLGACLAMSAGWGDKASYNQSVTLPAGRYALKLDAYNSHTNAACNANYCGFVPTTGTATYSKKLSFPAATWVSDSISFYLTVETAGVINIGFTTSSNGSANGAKLFVDNVKLIYYGIDKSGLKILKDSATVMNNNRQDVGSSSVYADLVTAIANAQIVFDNTSATAVDVVSHETALKTAIANVYGAITLQTRKTTWTTFPYDATSAILNPSFESGFTSWTNVGFGIQTNTSFDPKKTGTNYAEKWVTAGTSLTNLKVSQTINNIPNGLYLLKVPAQAIQQTGTVYPGGAFIFANNDSTEVFVLNDYSVSTTVTNNTLNIGFKVNTTGNWVAVDNFQLTYVSDGSPYLLLNQTALGFTPFANQKTVNIKGGNLTNDVALSTTSSFSLSKTTITAAEAMAVSGVDVVVTCNGTSALANDSLIITCGSLRKKVELTLAESAITTSTAGIFFDQSMSTTATLNVSGDLFSNVTLTAPSGIALSETTITPADANAGKSITVTWNQPTRVLDKYIYLTSGVKKDSVLVFAVDNIISTWDGDAAEVTPSKMTDFGWDQTLADGITAGPVVFNEYNITGGSRYVPAANAAHKYRGKTWVGHRVAYLRSWGSPATNVFNLSVNLEANKTYILRGVSAWHNNETNPTFTYSVNTAKANLGTTLGTQSVAYTVKQQGEDYGFEFTPTTTATHYLTVSSSAINDAMCGVDYLAIYPKVQTFTAVDRTDASEIEVYPTVNHGSFNVVSDKGTIRVFDVAGRLVAAKVASSTKEAIILPSTGVYFVEVNSNNVTKIFKVISVK